MRNVGVGFMKKIEDTFSTYHPIINFIFFIGAFLFGMLLMHPMYLACSLILSMLYYITIKGSAGVKYTLGMLPFFLLLSVMNPLFNTKGETILFTYFGGRPFTLEAFLYGAVLAALFISVMNWFACYNAVMTSDKFLYLFGKWVPSLAFVLTMVLRLVPSYQKQIAKISGARKCVGKSMDHGTKREKAEHGLTIVSALTSWALEGGIITADGMRSRGYGCGKRTSFSLYRWEKRDQILLIFMMLCMGVLLVCTICGGTNAEFLPTISIEKNGYTIIGMIFYIIFLAIPTVINIWEDIVWNILRSKI